MVIANWLVFSLKKIGMDNPPFLSHQGSSSSHVMEVGNEVADQEPKLKENTDEMSEKGLDLEILEDQPNEGAEMVQKGPNEGAKPFE